MMPRWFFSTVLLLFVLAVGPTPVLSGQAVDPDAMGNDAISRLQEYLRVNTVNPPGNESRGADFFARIFDAEGIPYHREESAPGRSNIWARLDGGDEPALVLLHHMDVVPADESHWVVDPLGGVIRDGYLYGRGALDTKSGGILHLEAFLALHRAGRPLNRDVIFMATADEEAGGLYGAGWMVEHHPELFQDVGFLLNEGGDGTVSHGRVEFGIEVTQKVPLWLRLVATGEPGHGSTPHTMSAVTRLLQALDNLRHHPFQPRIVPAVGAYFKGLASTADPAWRDAFADMATAVKDPAFLERLQLANPYFHALTRNTCSITRLEGSSKINVVPPEAAAELDCRLLPDQDREAFLDELTTVLDDPGITIHQIMGFTPAVSRTDTDLYRAIVAVVRRHYPDASILPTVASGFTDSHFFRDLGITSYGFFPLVTPLEDGSGVHGNNERIPLDAMRTGTRVMLEIVQQFVY